MPYLNRLRGVVATRIFSSSHIELAISGVATLPPSSCFRTTLKACVLTSTALLPVSGAVFSRLSIPLFDGLNRANDVFMSLLLPARTGVNLSRVGGCTISDLRKKKNCCWSCWAIHRINSTPVHLPINRVDARPARRRRRRQARHARPLARRGMFQIHV